MVQWLAAEFLSRIALACTPPSASALYPLQQKKTPF